MGLKAWALGKSKEKQLGNVRRAAAATSALILRTLLDFDEVDAATFEGVTKVLKSPEIEEVKQRGIEQISTDMGGPATGDELFVLFEDMMYSPEELDAWEERSPEMRPFQEMINELLMDAYNRGLERWHKARTRNPALTARISIRQKGTATVTWTPSPAEPTDLGLLSLLYGAKIGWFMDVEPQVRPVFMTLGEELSSITDLQLPSHSLIDMLPTAREIRADLTDEKTAVSGGEVFDIQLCRKSTVEPDGSEHPLTYVDTRLPDPGLAANIPWSAILLADKVWEYLDLPLRQRLVAAWGTMLPLLSHDSSIKPGDQRHLHMLHTLFLLLSAEW